MTTTETIRALIERWADDTRNDRKESILANHATDCLIYDVLPPALYRGTAAYRAGWGEWQPENTGEATFDLHDLEITAGHDVAFAHARIHCGGTTTGGKTYEDWVRATFCLRQSDGLWKIAHQHISMPVPN